MSKRILSAADVAAHRVLVVTGDSIIGLSVIRSLGRRGLEAMCVSTDSEGVGHYSRYCRKWIRLGTAGKDFVRDVLDFIQRNNVSHLLAIPEHLILLFNEFRPALEEHVTLLFPGQEVFETAHYKDITLRLAKEAGVPIPRTEVIADFKDVARCAQLRFPVVLKPRHRDFRLGLERVLNFKVDYACSYPELTKKMAAFKELGEFPLVQEYCEGHGVGVEVLMGEDKPLLIFQHQRIREYPPRGGVSVFCESIPLDEELVAMSVRLLKKMRWRGVAMVEFRRNDATGEAFLMEVNGRLWGSLPLALQSGADFPYLLYRSYAAPASAEAPASYKIGVKSRSLAGDTKWLVATWKQGLRPRWKATLEYLAAFRPTVRYFLWASDDPLPAIMNLMMRFGRLLSKPVSPVAGGKSIHRTAGEG